MKKQAMVLIFFLCVQQITFGQAADEVFIKQAFNGYKTAILNDKGDEALKFIDTRTINYYGYILELVKNADSIIVDSLSVLDKLMVLSVRHRTSREDILSFDGKKLLVYAIKSGMVGKSSVANISIGEVKVDGEVANGQVVNNGQKTPIYFNFYKEDGQWKIDLTSIFQVSTMAFKQVITESGQAENQYLLSILEMLTGNKPGKEIWEPVK